MVVRRDVQMTSLNAVVSDDNVDHHRRLDAGPIGGNVGI